MKTTYLPNIKSKKKEKNFILIGALIAFIVFIVIFWDFSYRFIARPFFGIFQPFINLKINIDNLFDEVKISLHDKEIIQEENEDLREKNMQLELKNSFADFIERENNELKKIIFSEDKRKFIISSIISRPPQTPYDIIIIDNGSDDGIRESMQVLASENILLGYVADVFQDTSKVKLISSFGEEINVLLESSGVSTIATGKGGENFEIILPRTINVNMGEKIIYPGRNPLFIGIIEKIEQRSTDPFQKIIFRLPFNINYLSHVLVVKK